MRVECRDTSSSDRRTGRSAGIRISTRSDFHTFIFLPSLSLLSIFSRVLILKLYIYKHIHIHTHFTFSILETVVSANGSNILLLLLSYRTKVILVCIYKNCIREIDGIMWWWCKHTYILFNTCVCVCCSIVIHGLTVAPSLHILCLNLSLFLSLDLSGSWSPSPNTRFRIMHRSKARIHISYMYSNYFIMYLPVICHNSREWNSYVSRRRQFATLDRFIF